ncbi:hypothetical protein Poli38472_009032 [Pythium oligandrum]|uniref:RING-type E3 ubiquitin transferase n=1 Tax=Pythium oligandrum TaxID=41045 RepID=A0A8K1CLJ1_PYTOL|nr:hypothetical protein Poli38472_009032 [Pythium oligandrum]|eukprot:TMW64865.1 hypothetical protein Poli38472_009032 [Pythium oligandrum]
MDNMDDMDEWLWPEAYGELRQLESTLRCLICGDFFHGPVLLPCSHTFCSECVRRFLQSRGAHGCCPECKQPCAPRDLVPNRSVEKVVTLFKQVKPKVLPVLSNTKQAAVTSTTQDTTQSRRKQGGASSKPPDRMPLLSYNMMKEKEIKKLLESIDIRVPIKNRDDIIQIHKEYVLLANAQADSSNPKSAAQVRDEVMRNYRARQQEKKQSSRKSTEAGGLSDQMKANFEKLKQQVAARKAKQASGGDGGDEDDATKEDQEEDAEDHDEEVEGVWRHVKALKTNTEFYIHSTTHEIRLEKPAEFEELQRRAIAEASSTSVDEIDLTGPSTEDVKTVDNEAIAAATASDDDDFEVLSPSKSIPAFHISPATPLSTTKTPHRRAAPTPTSSGKKPRLGNSFFSPGSGASTPIQESSAQHAQTFTASASASAEEDMVVMMPSASPSSTQ